MSDIASPARATGAPTASLSPYLAQAGDHQQLQWMGTGHLRVLLDAARTGGQLTMIEEHLGQGDITPWHVHEAEDEMFLVLRGTIWVWFGDQDSPRDLDDGGIAFLPRGIPHAFKVTSDQAWVLMVCTPGGIEGMFREAGWDLRNPLPDGWEVSLSHLARSVPVSACVFLVRPLRTGPNIGKATGGTAETMRPSQPWIRDLSSGLSSAAPRWAVGPAPPELALAILLASTCQPRAKMHSLNSSVMPLADSHHR